MVLIENMEVGIEIPYPSPCSAFLVNVIWGEVLNLWKPRIPHLYNLDNNSTYLIRSLCIKGDYA